jgi:NAD(P)H-hydrate epimerase
MRLVTGREMQEIDRRTIGGGLVPSLVLMENAGQAAAREAIARLGQAPAGKRVEILCGKGNNGGDGLVIARVLAARGASVRVHLTHPLEALTPDARANAACLDGTGVELRTLPERIEGSLTDLSGWLAGADLCVDALLGTGVADAVRGRMAMLVDLLDRASRNTLAVDVPSGVDADTGAVLGTAVRADVTVTFGLPKLGLLLHPGAEKTGRLVVADIGFPTDVVDAVAPDRFWVEDELARSLLPRLAPTAHKYARGCVLVVAGSRAYTGAAALAAEAALRSGAGIVHLAVPESIRAVLQTKLTEVIVHGAPETAEGTLSPAAMPVVSPLLERADAVAVGSGLGMTEPARDLVRELLAGTTRPAVVDADAVSAIGRPPHRAPRVATPHAGELERWTARPAGTALERLSAAARTAEGLEVVVLAKGAPTFVATPQGALFVNGSGHAGLATAGSGDVLTGVVAALLAQGLAPGDAASLGAFLHGRAAEIATRDGSPRSLLAGDLLRNLGRAYRSLEQISSI